MRFINRTGNRLAGRPDTARTVCIEYLLQLFATHTSVPRNEIVEWAKQRGISYATLNRAHLDLRISTSKSYLANGDHCYRWQQCRKVGNANKSTEPEADFSEKYRKVQGGV